jgi:pimeloyl-ACP methyl ester carboxylesterase
VSRTENREQQGTEMSEQRPNTIVLIHGLWMTPLSWENWIDRYQTAGYEVIAPAWPGMEGGIDALRADPTAIEHLGVEEIVDHYDAIITKLSSPPIIMGHSFGGAFAEVLLDRGLGAAGVAIDAAAVKGITKLPFAQLKSAFPVLKNPANNHRAVALTPSEFHYAFTNTMSEEDSRAAFERYAVPGPGRVLFQGAFANFNPRAATHVNFRNDDRAPLLLIAGEDDHTVPAVVDRSAAKHYRKSSAITEYKEFPGRAHFIIGQQGWEEVADYALAWAAEHARMPAAS